MSTSRTLPPRKRREDSFLGVHFDFHAGADCTNIGERVTHEMIGRIIALVKPDYLQCDCKGHPGISSYPTRVGHAAPGFVRDALRIWRDVTAEHGVALYMHYSGVWDSAAVQHHPSWACVNELGKRDKNQTSVFGPYVDKLLIPQLQELCDDYGVDGAWVDGECWATLPDYGRQTARLFRDQTGLAELPKSAADPHYFTLLEFCREGFRQYLRHYVDALHRHHPGFQIASNWAFSSMMPEPVSANVDFLSGDYPMQDSVNAARLEARCLAKQGKPWDLMAWAFSSRWEDHCRSTKSVPQLQQEAAVVLALGGGFQAYIQQERDASIREWTLTLMAEVADFCRARQPFCHRAETVPQIGLLYSTAAYYRKAQKLFAPSAGELVPMTGILHALLDNQQAVDIVMEHHLAGQMHDYPLLIVPEWGYLAPGFMEELRAYVRQGGTLLLIGPQSTALFSEELDITLQGEASKSMKWLEHNGWLAGTHGGYQAATLGARASAYGRLYERDDLAGPASPAAAITPYGAGRIAAVFMELGERYRTARTSVVRDFLGALVAELFPHPLVSVTGSHFVDVVVTRNHGKLTVNLLNTAGPHHDPSVYVYDEVPPLGPLTIRLRLPEAPTAITRYPAGEALSIHYANGIAEVTLPRLEIHDVLVVEGGGRTSSISG